MQTVLRSQLGRFHWYFTVSSKTPFLRSMSSSPREISIPIQHGSIAVFCGRGARMLSLCSLMYRKRQPSRTGQGDRESSSLYFSPKKSQSKSCFDVATPLKWALRPYHLVEMGKVWNEDGQIPILALHGWLDNAGTWDGVAPLLPKNFKLIAVDLLGHGFSSPPPMGSGGYFTEHIVTIERIVRHFGWKKINLLGHSMGGGAAMFYAGTFPEKVNKLIMLDLIKPISLEPDIQPERSAQAIEELLAAEKRFESQPPQYDYDVLVQRLITSYGQAITEKAAKTLLLRGAKQGANGKYSFNFDPRLKAASILLTTFEQQKAFASHIKCDMLVIKATNGPSYEQRELYEDILQVYQKSAKTFKYHTVEGNHHVHLNEPETVAPLITDFFKDLSLEDYKSSDLCGKLKNAL